MISCTQLLALFAAVPTGAVADRVAYDAPDAPHGWVRGDHAAPTEEMHLHFLLQNKNVALLEQKLLAVSDPTHAEYGKHMSNDAVHRLVAPSLEAVRSVRAFIAQHKSAAAASTPNSDILEATM